MKDDGGPAFPRNQAGGDQAHVPGGEMWLMEHSVQCIEFAQDGMSLRDWFAGQALMGGMETRCAAIQPEFSAEERSEYAGEWPTRCWPRGQGAAE